MMFTQQDLYSYLRRWIVTTTKRISEIPTTMSSAAIRGAGTQRLKEGLLWWKEKPSGTRWGPPDMVIGL